MANAKYLKSLRAEDRKRGRCTICHKEPAAPRKRDGLPSARCLSCMEKDKHPRPKWAARLRVKREAKKKLGLCRESGCDGWVVPGMTRCGYHLEMNAEYRTKHLKQKESEQNIQLGQSA